MDAYHRTFYVRANSRMNQLGNDSVHGLIHLGPRRKTSSDGGRMAAPPMGLAVLVAEAALRETSMVPAPCWLLPRVLPLRPFVVTAHPSEPPPPAAADAAAEG